MIYIYIKSLLRKDFIVFYIWISAAIIGLYLLRQIIALIITLGSIAGFVAYLKSKPPRIISIKQFIRETEISEDSLKNYFDVLSSKEGDACFIDRDLSNKLITKMLSILRNYNEFGILYIYKLESILNKHWMELEFYLNTLPLTDRLEKLVYLLNAFIYSSNLTFISKRDYFISLRIIEKILSYILLSFKEQMNEELRIGLDQCKKNIIDLLNAANGIILNESNSVYDDIEIYRNSEFRHLLINYIFIINCIIIFNRMNNCTMLGDTSVEMLLYNSNYVIIQIENKYRGELKSTNQQKAFIARDVLSCTKVINTTLVEHIGVAK